MESLPFIGGNEIPELFTQQGVLERAVLTDNWVVNELSTYKALILLCNKTDRTIEASPRFTQVRQAIGHRVDERVMDDEGWDLREALRKRIGNMIEEMQGVYRKGLTGELVIAKDTGGQAAEVFSRMVALGIIEDLPQFTETSEDRPKDYLDHSDPNFIICKYYFEIPDSQTGQLVKKVCEVKINRSLSDSVVETSFSDAIQKTELLKKQHQLEIVEFRKRYGKIKIVDYRDRNNEYKTMKTMKVGKALQEIRRREEN